MTHVEARTRRHLVFMFCTQHASNAPGYPRSITNQNALSTCRHDRSLHRPHQAQGYQLGNELLHIGGRLLLRDVVFGCDALGYFLGC